MYKMIWNTLFMPAVLGLHYWLGWSWILVMIGSIYSIAIVIFFISILIMLKSGKTAPMVLTPSMLGSSIIIWIISIAYYIFISSYLLLGLLITLLVFLLGFCIVNANNK